MSKVKITQEQADAIENITYREHAVELQINGWKHKENRCLNHLALDDFIKALYIGYEVEPEYKVGDWIVKRNGEKFYITHRGDGFPIAVRITNITTSLGVNVLQFCDGSVIRITEARHATPEEIAKEKERRWWAKNDRDVWEIREDDILEYLNDLYIVDSFDSEKVCLKSGIERKTNYAEPFDYVKRHFKVVCFAEDRKDV